MANVTLGDCADVTYTRLNSKVMKQRNQEKLQLDMSEGED